MTRHAKRVITARGGSSALPVAVEVHLGAGRVREALLHPLRPEKMKKVENGERLGRNKKRGDKKQEDNEK